MDSGVNMALGTAGGFISGEYAVMESKSDFTKEIRQVELKEA